MVKLYQQRAAALQITGAGFGERQIASSAVDETRSEVRFEHRNCPCDERIRDIELLSRAAKTFRIRHAHEDAHCMDLVHLVALSVVPQFPDPSPGVRRASGY